MKHYILYIPGLGDGYDDFRAKALRTWSLFGVTTQLVPMQWYDGKTYESKFQHASDIIADKIMTGATVSLIGESAGGSMAINLFAAHPKVARLITIAGVNKSSTPVAARTLRRGPAFALSRQHLNDSLSKIGDNRRRNIYTLSALSDNIVTSQYSSIPGANNRRILSIGHLLTITLCLTLLSSYIVHLAKQPTSV
jgi:pimeloyl-ACP methyl ester carboxylesterase